MAQEENQKHTSPLSEIPDHIKDYIQTQIAYYKLVAAETAGKAAAAAVSGILMALFGYLLLLFLSLAAAVGIGKALGHLYLGFLIVAGFYLLLIILVIVLKSKLIETPIVNAIIQKIANSGNKNETDGTGSHS